MKVIKVPLIIVNPPITNVKTATLLPKTLDGSKLVIISYLDRPNVPNMNESNKSNKNGNAVTIKRFLLYNDKTNAKVEYKKPNKPLHKLNTNP